MHRYKTPLLAIALLMLCLPLPASAQVPALEPLKFETRYDISLGPMGIGRLRIIYREDTFGYRIKVDTKTRGLVHMFAPLQSVAEARGSKQDGSYVPTHYISKADKDGDEKDRLVEIRYDEKGHITERTRKPADSPTWRPVVPLAKANEATDPMSAFFVARKLMRDAMVHNQRETSVLTYDGARLARMTLKVVSRARTEINGKYVDAINTVLTREPIDGYTPKELKKFKEGDPTVHVYFSADGRLMPLKVSMKLFYGELSAVLVEQRRID